MPKPRAPDDPPKSDHPTPPLVQRSGCVPAPVAAAHRVPRPAVSPARVNSRTIARQPSSALLRTHATESQDSKRGKCSLPKDSHALRSDPQGSRLEERGRLRYPITDQTAPD